MKTRIFVVDDNPRVRQGLAALIDRQADFAVCGDSGGGAEGLSGIVNAKPEVVIVDIFASDGSGIELVRQLKLLHVDTSVIGFSDHADADFASTALNEGAVTCVSKADSVVRLLLAIRNVRAIRLLSGLTPGDAPPPWKIAHPRGSPADSRAA